MPWAYEFHVFDGLMEHRITWIAIEEMTLLTVFEDHAIRLALHKNDKIKSSENHCAKFERRKETLHICILFDPPICRECGQDHSFNNFEKTGMDDFLMYIAIGVTGGGLGD